MKKLALVAVALVGTSQAAIAAPYNWTGFYAGFNLGVDAGASTFTDMPSGNGLAWLAPGDTFTANRVGANVGIDAGYNLQLSDLVVGVEADLGYLGGDGRGESQGFNGAGIFGYIQGGGYASLRLRAGIAADRLLVFGTAGGIIADHGAYMQDVAYDGLTGETGPQGGWTAGGGFRIRPQRQLDDEARRSLL